MKIEFFNQQKDENSESKPVHELFQEKMGRELSQTQIGGEQHDGTNNQAEVDHHQLDFNNQLGPSPGHRRINSTNSQTLVR